MKLSRPAAALVIAALAGAAAAQTSYMHSRILTQPGPQINAGKALEALTPNAPTSLHAATDQQDCGRHAGPLGGALLCAGVASGDLALAWTWNGVGVDGYRVYRTDGGRRQVIGTQTAGVQITMFLVPKPADGYGGKCYSVTAYSGVHESALSDAFCTSGASTVRTVSLTPQQQLSREKYNGGGSGMIAPPGISRDGVGDATEFDVGFVSFTVKRATGDGFSNSIYRTAVLFDTSSLMHKNIYSAHLRLRVARTDIGRPDPERAEAYDYSTSCLARIGYGVDYWWQHPGWIDAAVASEPGEQTGPDVSYDVTAMVREWTNGQRPNYGMVLIGPSEDLGAFLDKGCSTAYAPSSVALDVQYSG